MLVVQLVGIAFALGPGGRHAVAPQRAPRVSRAATVRCSETAAADDLAAAQALQIEQPKLESSCGFDFIPLLSALQAGEFREADGITRQALITLAGPEAVERKFVYYADVRKLPIEDMATIERLWRTYSNGKFGYTVQRQAYATASTLQRQYGAGTLDVALARTGRRFLSKTVGKIPQRLFGRLGWLDDNKDGKDYQYKRWLPKAEQDEFIYELEKAPKGHLPLTNTIRGTRLLEQLLNHPAWEGEEFADAKF